MLLIGLLIMLQLFLVYPNIVDILLTLLEGSAAHYILGVNHFDLFKKFDLNIYAFNHTYTFHKLLAN